MKIKSVYDNPETFDRYTVIFNEHVGLNLLSCLNLSLNCTSPDGVSQFGSVLEGLNGKHLGKQIKFTDLPVLIRDHVLERIREE